MKIEHTDENSSRYEITLRAIGQALEVLGVESFELALEGDSFVVYGGPEASASPTIQTKVPSRFSLFRQKPKTRTRGGFYITGMRLRASDIKRLDGQGKDARINAERCPDTNSISHGLRMIGAHLDKTEIDLLGITRHKGLFTVWHKSPSGRELKQVFNQANLYDLWVHLYKKRTGSRARLTGT